LINDSISFSIAGSLVEAQPVKYILAVNNGSFTRNDTITKVFGTPVTLFYDNGSSQFTNLDPIGTWGFDSGTYISSPSCITDSPGMDYDQNNQDRLTTKNQLDLQDAIYAHLQFYTKFDIEKTFDYAQIRISTDNGVSYTPLCARYETPPVSSLLTFPVYDGRQDEWVKDEIDLSAYIGQKIKIRFMLDSDFYDEKDGIYLDDIFIRKLVLVNTVGIQQTKFMGDLVLSPNPSSGIFNLYNPDQKELSVTIYNSMGQLILDKAHVSVMNSEIDLSSYVAGIYVVKLKSGNEEMIRRIILEK